MKLRILTTVSTLALMAVALPVQAQSNTSIDTRTQSRAEVRMDNNQDVPRTRHMSEDRLERGWDRTQDAVSRAAERTGDMAENAYNDVRDAVTGDPFLSQSVQVSQRNTARGMIGKNTYTPEGEVVATVEDIIIDRNGNAEQIVLRDGGFLGLGGSLVSLDYEQLVRPGQGGDSLQTVSQEAVSQSRRFDYNQDRAQAQRNAQAQGNVNANANAATMPAEALSVSEILDGALVNDRNEQVADIENLTFRNGDVDYLIVSFNDTLGMGGETAAINFSDLQPARMNGQVNFRMSASQSQDFQDYQNMIQSRPNR